MSAMDLDDGDGFRPRPEGGLGYGLWCMECMLPSAILWRLDDVGHPAGSAFRGQETVVICEDCGTVLDDEGWAE